MASSTIAKSDSGPVDILEAIIVNGSKQWILTRGANKEKPILLFVHGGPGSPLMWFSRAFDEVFIQDFVVVHWDQRASGKSFDPAEPHENYRFDNFVNDGIVVAEHLKSKFQKDNILLVGHSWGTMVAFHMVVKRPDLFSALITTGTVSSMGEMEEFRYGKVSEAIVKKNDPVALDRLKNLGQPPFLTFDRLMAFGDLVREFVGFEGTFHNLTMDQLNGAVAKNKEYTETELVVSMKGMKVLFNELSSFLYSYDAHQFVPKVSVPVTFVQGKFDFNTPTHLARNYFDQLDAAKGKAWIEFENSAHFPFYEEPEKFLEVLKKVVSQ